MTSEFNRLLQEINVVDSDDGGITYTIMKKYYPGEPVNINIQSLINIIQDENRVITTKKG